jgi:uncharacterized membrane-anchored protein
MPFFQNPAVRFTSSYVIINEAALRLSAIETIEKKHYESAQRYVLRIKLNSGKRYDLEFNSQVDNLFDLLTNA